MPPDTNNTGSRCGGWKGHAAEALACIAFKQPISQAETETPFAADKRRLLVKLRDLKLVEEFAGSNGRLHSCSASGLASLQELSASFGSPR